MIAALGVSALLFTACGSDEVPVTTGSDTEESSSVEGADGEPIDGETLADKADELTQPVAIEEEGTDMADDLTAEGSFSDAVSGDVDRSEILDPRKWEIENAAADPSNDNVLVVTYTAGHPPCAQAFAEVAESDDAVKVTLQVGLHPNVAAMTCPAAEMQDTIEVSLNAPLGDRTIELDQP